MHPIPTPLTDLSFDDWLAHCFDRPTTGPVWYHDPCLPHWRTAPALRVRHLTRLFGDPVAALSRYSDEQVNLGLWYIAQSASSDDMLALLDASVPLAERVACIRAIETLYAQCFAVRCSAHLSHGLRSSDEAAPLNSACYMFWDLVPLMPEPGDPARRALDDAVLHVLDAVLRLPSIACQESALHGLGHWQFDYPEQVGACIARYLERVRPDGALRAYAEQAAVGNVQ